MARKLSKAAEQELFKALAVGATVESAARRAGIGERTAYRRLADPAFQARLRQARLDTEQRTLNMLTAAGPGFVKVLVDVAHDSSAAASVRRGAARDGLELAVKYRVEFDLAHRVGTIEEKLAQRG